MGLFLAPAYAKDVPPRDIEELHQTLRALEERICRLDADQSSQNVQQEHEELRPRFGLNLGLYGDVSSPELNVWRWTKRIPISWR
jgi:hypothetical protein